jgi:uncharacterized protein (TIGR03067 family)
MAIVGVLVTLASVQAQTPAGVQPLQGRWTVTSGEHDGRPMDAIKGGVMTVTGEAFEIRTASGNMLRGTLRVDTAKTPFQMDLLHADGARWEAIYEVNADGFRLNYVEAGGKDRRPDTFTTGNGTEASIVRMRREPR